jgi:hypothetical protein
LLDSAFIQHLHRSNLKTNFQMSQELQNKMLRSISGSTDRTDFVLQTLE